MTRNLREYHRPAEVAEAAALLGRGEVRTAPLALGARVPEDRLAGVEAVVDQARLGLDYLKETDDGLVRLGSGLTMQALADSVLAQSLAGGILAEAAVLAGGSAMRHAATLCGALLHARRAASGATREGPPELMVALLALGAEVVFHPEGQGTADLAAYLSTGGGAAEGTLLIEVRFARPSARAHGALARVARTPRDQAIVAVAALLEGDSVRLAVAAGGHPPQRMNEVEASLAGRLVTDEHLNAAAGAVEAAVSPQSDFRASAEYRRAMAGVLARRALADAIRRAG